MGHSRIIWSYFIGFFKKNIQRSPHNFFIDRVEMMYAGGPISWLFKLSIPTSTKKSFYISTQEEMNHESVSISIQRRSEQKCNLGQKKRLWAGKMSFSLSTHHTMCSKTEGSTRHKFLSFIISHGHVVCVHTQKKAVVAFPKGKMSDKTS